MNNWPFGCLTQNGYRVIYCDPAWQFNAYNDAQTGVPQRAAEMHYDTMTVEEMAEIPVADLAANDCALIMWTIPSHLPQAFWLADQWGFRYSTKLFCWAKLNKNAELNLLKKHSQVLPLGNISDDDNWFMGMGYSSRRNTEDCYLFTKGKPKRRDFGVRELIVSPVREHSRKPDEAYSRIERLYNGPYCELFARTTRPNWSSWGNQKEKF